MMGSTIKVLLIEDNPGDARLIQEMLSETSGATFEYECKDRLASGLKRIIDGQIDIVLLDLSLPDSKGFETFKAINAQTPGVPIIVLSGLDDEVIALKAVQAGAQDYLVKGNVDSNLLARSIRYAIERRKAEEDLRNSEERLKIIFEHAPDPYYMMDLEGNFIGGNKATESLIGYNREELIGKNLADAHLMGTVQLAKAMGLLARNIRGEPTGPDEFVLIRKDGTEVNVEIRSHPVRIRDQTVILGLARDITERKMAEKALIESEEKLRRILESSPDAITVTDLYGNIIECNQATLDMYGFASKEEILGKNAFDFISQNDRARAMEAMMETLDNGHSKNLEYFLQTRNGRIFPAELSASVIMDQNENPTSFVTITKNITERKRAEEELIQSEKLAGIGTLASGVAHEVNNPLAGIMGYAEIIQEEHDLDKIREYTEKILKNTKRASDIVRWLSRYSRQAKDTDIRDVNLQEVIDDALEALTHTRRSSDIELIKDFQRIPAIRGNRSELLQIFVNLMSNSVDAMPRGGRLNITSSVNDGTVEVKIRDNGEGIPEDKLNRIFEPFFTTKEVGKGTGLGLYVSSMLVKKHHGTIEVKSEVGRGTAFTMRYPISEVSM